MTEQNIGTLQIRIPELVEGLPFSSSDEEGQPFDKLRDTDQIDVAGINFGIVHPFSSA